MKKLLTLFALLVVCVSGAWAEDVTIGATDNTTAYLGAKSEAFALNGNGTWKFNFTNYNAGNGGGYNNFILNANDGTADKFNLRADMFEVIAWNNANITRPGYTWTDEATFVTDMNGAEVDMTVSRVGNVIYVNSTITPSNGTAAFKYNYTYSAAAGNLNLYLSVDNSYLVLHEAKEYTSVYAADFETEATYKNGWTINNDLGPTWAVCSGTSSHYIWMKNGSSGNRAFSISFAENNYFMTAEDYRFEFDFNYGGGNSNGTANTVTITSNNSSSKLFTLDKTATAWSGQFDIHDAAGNALTDTPLPGTVDYKNPFAFFYHFLVEGIKDDGVYLTVSNGDEEKLTRVKVADFAPVMGFSSNMGKNMVGVGFDNIIFSMHSENEIVPDPSASITGVNGTNRTVTLTLGEGSPDGSNLYYSDNSDGSAATLYSAPIVVTESKTVYFYTLSAKGNKSAIQSIDVDCSALTLVAPTIKNNGWNTDHYSVTLTSNQNSILLKPTATIKYKINDGDAQTYSGVFDVIPNDQITAWTEATGYTNSSNAVATATTYNTNAVAVSESYSSTSGDKGISVDQENGKASRINTTQYYYMYYTDGEKMNFKNFVTSNTGINNWLYRAGGIYGGNTQSYMIMGLEPNDYITITYGSGSESPIPNIEGNDATVDSWNSKSNQISATVKPGKNYVRFSFGRYGYITGYTVKRAAMTKTSSANLQGYKTFYNATSNYKVDANTTIYTATAANASVVTISPVEGETVIPAGTPVMLKTTANDYKMTLTPTLEAATQSYDSNLFAVAAGGETNKYILAYTTANGLKFYQYTPGLDAGDVYLDIVAGAPVRFVVGGEATAIKTVEATTNNAVRYNLAGQRVNANAKGIIVVNGKKVLN